MAIVNKKEIAAYIAANHGLETKKEAEEIITDIFTYISASLQGEGEVNIADFGKFISRTKKARKARNPKTGEEVMVAEKTTVIFRTSKGLKEILN